MRADGSNRRLLVGGAGDDVEPAWSPDGTRIAFASTRDGRYELWAVGAAGGEPSRLVDAPGRQWAPAWSPDGKRLAFTGVVDGATDVWVATLDTGASRRLTTAPAFDGRPDWSPDGRRLAFVSTRGGAQRIWVMGADGSGQRALTTSHPGDSDPDWTTLDAAMIPPPDLLLPDLDQQAPSGLIVKADKGRIKLGFTSAVDNIGAGPMHIRGTRGVGERTMRAEQLIETKTGSRVVVRGVGRLAFEPHPPHHHWHLEPYATYELYRASDGAWVGRDGKSGFCLLDRWGRALKRPGLVVDVPHFTGDCATGRPRRAHGRRGDVRRLYRSVSGLLPRTGHRHHRSRTRPLRPRAPLQPGAAAARAPLLQRRGLRPDQDHGPQPDTGLPGVRVLLRCPDSDWCAAG